MEIVVFIPLLVAPALLGLIILVWTISYLLYKLNKQSKEDALKHICIKANKDY
ncbi:MAG: hypothetical protein [Bacteriophage sp.]|nr:MAG: hypothetical protein [Bacteriophage sp.]